MSKCEIKTGFFVLKDCENAAVDTCSICGRAVCQEHKRFVPENMRKPEAVENLENQVCCMDCYADLLENMNKLQNDKNANQRNSTAKIAGAAAGAPYLYYDDDSWMFSHRRSYYKTSHYRPHYHSHSSNSKASDEWFDKNEVRTFSQKTNPEEDGQLRDNFDNEGSAFDS